MIETSFGILRQCEKGVLRRTLRVENLIGDIARVAVGKRGGWDSWSSRLELEAKVDTKRLALEEGLHEDEPELFFRGGKEEWQKFYETDALLPYCLIANCKQMLFEI